MLSEGIQSLDLCRIRSGAGDKKTSGVDEKNKLNGVYGTKYRINLDHPILTDHGVFYPQGLYNALVFELTLAPAGQVVNGSDASKLGYKLENIQLEYEVIRSKTLADESLSTYSSGKEFRVRPCYARAGGTHHPRLGHPPESSGEPPAPVAQRNPAAVHNPYTAGARESESYFNPDITKVKVTVNGVPNRVYNEGISVKDMWNELTRHFNPHSGGCPT